MKFKYIAILAAVISLIFFASCTSKENFEQTNQENTVETGKIENQDVEKPTAKQSLKKEINVPYTPAIYQTLVEQYKVNEDFSNIENLSQFGNFSDENKKLLSSDAFFVSPSNYDQLFYIYEKNASSKFPSFISSDSVIQAYDMLLKYSQQVIEKDNLVKTVEDLTQSMLNKFIYLYQNVKDPNIKACILKNTAYFGTAQLALLRDLPPNMPDEAKALAEEEYSLIQNEWGYKKSSIFPFKIDYGLFSPEGHYKSSLERYFKAMTWYCETPFPIYLDIDEEERDEEQTLEALLITYALFMDKDDVDPLKWEKLYETTSLFNGKSDYLSIYEYKDLLTKIYGENPDIESINDKEKLDRVYDEAENFREPNIISQEASAGMLSGKQFRFMGHGTIPDSEVFSQLTDLTKREAPSGLDIMSVLGSDRAYELQMTENTWDDYPKIMESLKALFLNKPDTQLRSNVYYSWLWTLKSFTKAGGSGYPSFMNNNAWLDKSLNTALGSWALLHYDDALNVETAGQKTETLNIQKTLGYVEPSIEVYGKLQWLIRYLRQNFESRGMLTGDLNSMITDFEDLLSFLTNCSVKELRNEKLTDEEYMKISEFGTTLHEITNRLMGDGSNGTGNTSKVSLKSMEMVSDISNSSFNNSYLEAGLGPAGEIYVVVPIDGKLYLTRGAVLSYYEFFNKSGYRLTDGEWQDMIEKGDLEQPVWKNPSTN